MTDLRWEHYEEQKREEMIDEIYESLPMIHANKGNLELKSVISHVDASYDDWERFINKEDISYCSTAGGAFLEFIEGKELPSIRALSD